MGKWKVKGNIAQLCLTLCDPMDYTAHGTLQARILEWVAVPIFRGSSQPRDQTQVSCIAGGFFTSWLTRKTLRRCERGTNEKWFSGLGKAETWSYREKLTWIKTSLSYRTLESPWYWRFLAPWVLAWDGAENRSSEVYKEHLSYQIFFVYFNRTLKVYPLEK